MVGLGRFNLLKNEGGRRDTRGSLEIAEWEAHGDGDRRQKVMKPRGAESECQFVEMRVFMDLIRFLLRGNSAMFRWGQAWVNADSVGKSL
jgi:hypothetical protein